MSKNANNKPVYDLEERTFVFAKDVRLFVKTLKYSIANNEDIKQVTRSSGSIGANYLEANEALSKKDFLMRVKIARKEAKESVYWLRLIFDSNDLNHSKEVERLINEATELKNLNRASFGILKLLFVIYLKFII